MNFTAAELRELAALCDYQPNCPMEIGNALREYADLKEAAEKGVAELSAQDSKPVAEFDIAARALKILFDASVEYRLAVRKLFSVKDGKVLAELSPTKDQDCFDAFVGLDAAGKKISAVLATLEKSDWSKIAAPSVSAQDASPKDGWQPIETAPKDGRWILQSHIESGGRPWIGRYAKGTFSWWDERGTIRDPTHWQPLPEPPHD